MAKAVIYYTVVLLYCRVWCSGVSGLEGFRNQQYCTGLLPLWLACFAMIITRLEKGGFRKYLEKLGEKLVS